MVQVQDGANIYTVEGRAAAMILYVAQQAVRLNALPRMRLEFHCAGFKMIRPKLEVIEDEVPVVMME